MRTLRRAFSTAPAVSKPKTGIVMMNMGGDPLSDYHTTLVCFQTSSEVSDFLSCKGPSHPSETRDFLSRLFNDNDIIEMGGGIFQKLTARFIVARRTPRIQKQVGYRLDVHACDSMAVVRGDIRATHWSEFARL
eukprot:1373130-Amorphochlora_amoeboformis.AAC.1